MSIDSEESDQCQISLKDIISMVKKNPKMNNRIKHPLMLLKYLNKLDCMIGNASIKSSMAEQIVSILKHDRIQGINTNAVLVGKPGTGKSTIAVYIAKILYAIGCLKGNSSADPTQVNHNKSSGINGYNNTGCLTTAVLWITMLFLVYVILSGILPPLYNLMGAQWFFILLGVFVFIGAIAWLTSYYCGEDNNPCNTNNKSNNNNQKEEKVKSEKRSNENKNEDIQEKDKLDISSLDDIEDDVVIQIISRADLVAEYVGHTARNVERIFRANLGKVIFIDEAYSLLNGPNDPFGKEALDTINKFIGENKGNLTLILAGYQKGITKLFKAQEGLPRRICWHLQCKDYNGEELADIFELQLKREGYNMIPDEIKRIKNFIADNYKYFPNLGGDSERLVNYVINKNDTKILKQEMKSGKSLINERLITFSDIKNAMVILKDNNIQDTNDNEEELDENNLMKFMNLLGGRNQHKVSSFE